MNPNVKSKNGVITYKGLKEIHTKILIALEMKRTITHKKQIITLIFLVIKNR